MSEDNSKFARYQRQMLLPQIGRAGQEKLARSRVLLVGCGALGCVIADQLVRSGVGSLRIADRDIVDISNLQRQVLFDEQDARQGLPKAVAAAARLGRINSQVTIEPKCVDVGPDNIEALAGVGRGRAEGAGGKGGVDLVMDGTDNVQTRYLINDVCVKGALPWIYGAAVAAEGRVMVVRPPQTPCLRCIFPQAPAAGELATCDTAGILSAAAAVVGSLQVAAAIKLLTGHEGELKDELLVLDLWNTRVNAVSLAGARKADCPTCGQRRFEFLEGRFHQSAVTLCGRSSVQVRPPGQRGFDLRKLAEKLAAIGTVEETPYLVRCRPTDPADITLTVFPDGRAIVQGTSDIGRARSLYARFIGI